MARAPHVIPIPGTRRPERLAENAGAADLTLTPADIAALDALFAPGAAAGARYPEGGMAGIESAAGQAGPAPHFTARARLPISSR